MADKVKFENGYLDKFADKDGVFSKVYLGNTQIYPTPPPAIVSINPTQIWTIGQKIQVTGTNFVGTITATLGGSAATNVVVISETLLELTTPAVAAGSYNLILQNVQGSSNSFAVTAVVRPAFKRVFVDFAGVANGPMPSGWTSRVLSGQAGLVPIINNQAVYPGTPTVSNTLTQAVTINNTELVSDNQQLSAITRTALSTTIFSGLVIKSDIGMQNFVVALVSASGDRGIWTRIDGVMTKRGTFSTSHAVGDTWLLKSEGKVYTLYRNGVVVSTWSDNANVVKSGVAYRRGGFYMTSQQNQFGQNTFGHAWDNFTLQDLEWTA